MLYAFCISQVFRGGNKHINRNSVGRSRQTLCSEQRDCQSRNTEISKSFREYYFGQQALLAAHYNNNSAVAAVIRLREMPHKAVLLHIEIFMLHCYVSMSDTFASFPAVARISAVPYEIKITAVPATAKCFCSFKVRERQFTEIDYVGMTEHRSKLHKIVFFKNMTVNALSALEICPSGRRYATHIASQHLSRA